MILPLLCAPTIMDRCATICTSIITGIAFASLCLHIKECCTTTGEVLSCKRSSCCEKEPITRQPAAEIPNSGSSLGTKVGGKLRELSNFKEDVKAAYREQDHAVLMSDTHFSGHVESVELGGNPSWYSGNIDAYGCNK